MEIEMNKISEIDLEKALKKGSYKTLNDLKRKITTVIVNEVFSKYNFKKKKTIRGILARTKRATFKNPAAIIKTKATYPLNLMKFSPKPSRRKNKTNPVPTVEIIRGSRKNVNTLTGKPSFLGKDKKGNTQIWNRLSKKRTNIKIVRLNMTIADMFSDDILERKYIKAFNELYPKRFEYFLQKEIDREMKKKGK